MILDLKELSIDRQTIKTSKKWLVLNSFCMTDKAAWELEPTSPTAHPQVLNRRDVLLFIYIINEVLDLSLIKI